MSGMVYRPRGVWKGMNILATRNCPSALSVNTPLMTRTVNFEYLCRCIKRFLASPCCPGYRVKKSGPQCVEEGCPSITIVADGQYEVLNSATQRKRNVRRNEGDAAEDMKSSLPISMYFRSTVPA